MSVGGQQGKSTEKQEPWEQQIPYILKGFDETDRLYGGKKASNYSKSQPAPTFAGVGSGSGVQTGANGEQYYTVLGTSGEQIKIPVNSQPTSPTTEGRSGDDPTSGYGGIVGQYYQGSTVAPLSDSTMIASDLAKMNAGGDNPYLDGEGKFDGYSDDMGYVDSLGRNTASGKFINSNPYLDAMYGRASEAVEDRFDDRVVSTSSTFNKGGRYGSGAHYDAEGDNKEILAKELGGLATDIYGKNYETERGHMESAQDRLSGAYRGDADRDLKAYSDIEANKRANIGALTESGQYFDDYNQDVLNSDIDRWDYNQNIPMEAINRYMALIHGDYGGTTNSKSKSMGFNMKLF